MMAGKLSLTKHYILKRLVDEIASLRPGNTVADVQRALGSPHTELADDIFEYDQRGYLRDSVLLQVCREGGGATALRVLWVSLVAADSRLRAVLRAMSQPSGKLNGSLYATTKILKLLRDIQIDSRKAASNLAHYFEQAQIVVPERRGPEIVGVRRTLDTGGAVPLCVAHLADVFGWDDPVENAVKFGVHGWLNLDVGQFKRLAGGAPVTNLHDEEPVNPPPVVIRSSGPPRRLPYIDQTERTELVASQLRQFDPEALENATQEHRKTQNALAAWARSNECDPVRPDGDPLFDVGWWQSERFFVAEVKSLSADNEARQVRLGLGQVLDYQKQLKDLGIDATAVLAVSQVPASSYWVELARELGVVLCWPPFDALDEWLSDGDDEGSQPPTTPHFS